MLALFLAIIVSVGLAFARTTASAPDARTLASSLPASDVVMFVDLHRIMLDIIPRLLANDPATLAKIMNAINEVRTKTGFNILGVDGVAGGLQFVNKATHEMKKENLGIVILVHGDFDANALIAFLGRETKGKLPQENYGGKVIYSEPQPTAPRNKKERETAALTVLDANTLALGDLPQVRATIDAAGGKGRIDPTLVQLAERDSSAVIGLAGNVPESLLEELRDSAPADDQMAQALHKALMGVKQLFGSIGATPEDFNVISGVRMSSAEQAASISDLLLGVRQHVVSEIPDQTTRSLVESLQITAQGDEVQIKCDIKNQVVQEFLASAAKNEGPIAKATAGKAKPRARSRRGKRRRRH
ncbi:MAG: hypothetical protein QOJ64_3614 [Acidobacteriota bacterium]|jgi:hypothetical protein|nr:hypothetical protein [Acidobacteriota bacterium]